MKVENEISITSLIVDKNEDFFTLLEALNRRINSNFGSGFALITDTRGYLVGVVEDSDIRKYLQSQNAENITIEDVMRKDFVSVDISMSENEIVEAVLEQLNDRGWNTTFPIQIVPITENKKPVGILDIHNLETAISKKRDRHIIIGLGYVGLTLALSLAQAGRVVHGVDKNKKKIDILAQKKSYILEPGIEQLIKTTIGKNFLPSKDFERLEDKPGSRKNFYICVGTPLDKLNSPNFIYINEVVEDISRVITFGDSIIMRSTVPMGTGREIIKKIESMHNWTVGVDFYYISAPERTAEGAALKEIRELPQLIAGATDECTALGMRIFKDLTTSIIQLDKIESAEIVKIMGNAFRDYLFAFPNYMINICQSENLDLNYLIDASNRGYPRSVIPVPSLGVGGPCLSKDTYFLSNNVEDFTTSSLFAARKINEAGPENAVSFIKSKVKNLNNLNCLAIGLAFKGTPETNDYRNSPALEFILKLDGKVKSIGVWDSVIDVKELDLGFSILNHNQDFNFYAILNNNIKNLDFLNHKILSSKFEEIVIYDPWRMLNPSHLSTSTSTRKIHYLSLSHLEIVNL